MHDSTAKVIQAQQSARPAARAISRRIAAKLIQTGFGDTPRGVLERSRATHVEVRCWSDLAHRIEAEIALSAAGSLR